MTIRALFTFLVLLCCASTAFAQGRSSSDAIFRAFGGVLTGGGHHGVGIGGGVAATPFGDEQREIQGDFLIGRVEGASAWELSGLFNYNFEQRTQAAAKPFLGGGVVILGSSDDSEAALQILGGLEKPLRGGRRAFRGEVRLQFFGSTVAALLAGISF